MCFGARGDAAGWDYETAFAVQRRARCSEQVNDGYPALTKILPILERRQRQLLRAQHARRRCAVARHQSSPAMPFSVKSALDEPAGQGDSRDTDGARRRARWRWRSAPNCGARSTVRSEPDSSRPATSPATAATSPLTDQSRDVEAAFGELNVVPLAKGLELNAAVRFDHYQGVGNSTTPKLSLRWQPAVVAAVARLRSGKGFRAPSLQDLYLPSRNNVTPAGTDDPLRCPVTGSRIGLLDAVHHRQRRQHRPDAGEVDQRDAGHRVRADQQARRVALDAFKINLKDTIVNGVSAPSTILGDLDKYGYLVTRGPVGSRHSRRCPGRSCQITQTEPEPRRDHVSPASTSTAAGAIGMSRPASSTRR